MHAFLLPVEPVPFDEVAAVLSSAAARASGGPAGIICANGRQLAAALEDAGFRVIRANPLGPQLTL
jgi:hypothetical protein